MTIPDLAALEDAINATYPGLMMFVRDANLPPALARQYTAERVIRERGFTDATPRIGGMVTAHRFVILSNHMADVDALLGDTRDPAAPHWDLHVANSDSRFKVLGQADIEGRTIIVLLHLPDDDRWRILAGASVNLDTQLLGTVLERMEVRLSQDPIPDVTTELWLDRCQFPVGMSDDGEWFPLEDSDCGTVAEGA